MKKLLSIMLTLVLSVSLMGCTKKADDQVAAKVNDRVITVGEFNKNVALIKKIFEAQSGSDIWTKDAGDGKTFEQAIREQILEKMITDELILQEAEKAELKVDQKQIEAQYQSVKNTILGNKVEYEKFKKDNGITEEFLKEQLKKDYLVFEYRNKYNKEHPITDKVALEYYDKNKSLYEVDQVRASHILIKTVDDAMKPLSEDKVKEAESNIKEVLVRAKNGEDFSKLASQFSQDPGSAKIGGDLGFFGKGQMVKEFEETAFAMKPGEISEVVKTQYGYHIIKVTDKKKESKSFEDVKDSLKAKMEEEAYNKHIEKLKEKAKIEQNKDLFKKK